MQKLQEHRLHERTCAPLNPKEEGGLRAKLYLNVLHNASMLQKNQPTKSTRDMSILPDSFMQNQGQAG